MSDDKIKVAQCLAGAKFGGAENFYTRLVCALATSDRLEQRAFTRENSFRVPQMREAGVPVSTFRFGSIANFLDRKHYREALRDFDPDIVLTYMNRASITTPADSRYKLVCRLGHYYNLKYYRHADYWVGISKGICRHLVAGGMPEERVFYIPNFADERIVDGIDRTSFDTPAGVPLLLAAGRLHVNKGFDILIKALVNIPDAILWLAGDGPKRKSLMRLAKKQGVEHRIRFLGWRNDVNALMETADIFICPSRHEGLGSIVMESWFHSCPIVATDSQGPGELIEDQRTGLVVPIDDVAQLAEAIQSLIDNPDYARAIAEQGKAHYNEFFSKAVIVDSYVKLFSKIMQDD